MPNTEGCPSPARTCTRPKTPKRSASLPSLSRDGRLLAPVSETASATLGAATTADVNLLYETPSRKTSATAMEEVVDGRKQSGIGSARKGCASIGHEEEGCGEGLLTPLPKGGSCAICLSPLAKKQGVKQEVYTIQLCRHIFHRGCLTENRRVGNVGCPYCRGTLERGLTPEATTEKKEALAAAAREQDQRQAIRNAAGRVRMAFARSLRQRQEALTQQEATVTEISRIEGSDDAPPLQTI